MAKTSDRSLIKKNRRDPGYQLEIDQRRVKVADMMIRRLPRSEMARRLKVDRTTITRDIKAIERQWKKTLEGKADNLRSREAATLDHLEMVAQLNMENALKQRQEVEQAEGGRAKSVAWERFDRAVRAWMEKRIQIQERRAKLLNLDAQPQQANVQVQMPISFIAIKSPDPPPVLDEGNVVEGQVVTHDA